MYRPLHPRQTVTITRRSTTSTEGEGAATTATVGTPVVGVEDVTGKIRRSPGGANVELALRLYTADATTIYKPRDRVTIVHRGETMADLEIEEIVGPFGSGRYDHQELLVVSRLGSSSGFNSAVA